MVLPARQPPPDDTLARRIRDQLDKLPLDDRSRQSQLAADYHLGEYRFVHLFKTSTGMTPKRYFTRRRVEFCRRQLFHTDTPVKVLAIDLGFNRLSDFSAWVKTNLGAAPTRLRRQRQSTPGH